MRYKAQQTDFFVILGHFLPFYPTNKLKNQNFEKMKKNSWRYYHFTFVYHECQSYDVRLLRYGVQQAKSFIILDHFLPFYLKIKILKKNLRRYHQFTLVYQTWQSYDVWFVRYKVQWTEFFVDYFLPFCPPPPHPDPLKTWKIKIFIEWKKKKKNPGDIIICTINTEMKIIWCMVHVIWSVTDRIFSHFRPVFVLLLP